jgi:site-specific recombinase XerD
MKETDFARTLTHFLSEYLPGQRGLSINTIKSYRDTFKQLLIFYDKELNIAPENVTFSKLGMNVIYAFLDWLEKTRGVSASTRNQRLAAIHSFYRYAQMENPELLLESQRVLNMPFKRHSIMPVDYLRPEALKAMLEQPNKETKKGRRDLTLIVTLYDTAARVQELVDIRVRDVRIASPSVITLTGKGNKKRHVPIMSKTHLLLKNYMEEHHLNLNGKQDHPLFFNSRHHKFTRLGITYILKKYFNSAKKEKSDIVFPEKIHPHMLRTSKAMHLLDANVNLIYIRDLLGHVNITTTERYAKANSERKRKALEAAYMEITEEVPDWNEDKNLINWLQELCK